MASPLRLRQLHTLQPKGGDQPQGGGTALAPPRGSGEVLPLAPAGDPDECCSYFPSIDPPTVGIEKSQVSSLYRLSMQSFTNSMSNYPS